MTRKLVWYAVDVLALFMLWLGLVHGVQGALNVGLTFVWLTVFGAVALLLSSIPPDDGPEPVWDVVHTCAVVGLLVWHDWFVSGLAYLAAHVLTYLLSCCVMTDEEWRAAMRARAERLKPPPLPPRSPGA